MLRISDGRKNFYQWDLNQKLIVDDAAVTQVHYCNSPDGEALVVEVKNGLVDVPNIFLTECWTILAFAFDGNSVREAYAFKVEPRAKPVDYIYTPTEVHTWDELNKKINDLVGFDLYDYYTKDEVNQLIGEIDLSAYAKKTDIPSLADYYTKSEVDNAIANMAPPTVDLTDYYTKTQVNNKLAAYAKTTDIADFVTEEFVDSKGYQTKAQVQAMIPDTSLFVTTQQIESKGYQNAEQVQSAIQSALSSIGNAEEGAY